jgi:hypothetical protein
VPILLHASPAQWWHVETINKAKHAVFLLLHARTLQLQTEPNNGEKYRQDASMYYSSAIKQLQQFKQDNWGTRTSCHCAKYFCIYEAITGNKKAAEIHMSYLLVSVGQEARGFLCFFTSLLPPEWKCYNFQIEKQGTRLTITLPTHD